MLYDIAPRQESYLRLLKQQHEMLRIIQSIRTPYRFSRLGWSNQLRTAATATSGKAEGTIADSFASLSGQQFEALEPRFATVKENLIRGNEQAVKASWDRLLLTLKDEVQEIKRHGSSIVPQIDFKDIDTPSEHFSSEYRKRGVAVIKGAIPEAEALQMKEDLREYIKANPQTKSKLQATPLKTCVSKLTCLPRLLITSVRTLLEQTTDSGKRSSQLAQDTTVSAQLLAFQRPKRIVLGYTNLIR